MTLGITTIKNEQIEAWLNDDLQLQYTVVDRNGDAVSLTGASAVFKGSEKYRTDNIFTISSADSPTKITFSSNVATVTLNTSQFGKAGIFQTQLRITKAGKTMLSAEGEIKVNPVIV